LENDEDYSDYFQVAANTLNIYVLLSGFTFTGTTILLGLYPTLGSLSVQFILFFLASLFFCFMFQMVWFNSRLMSLCRNRPPVTKSVVYFNHSTLLSFYLLQFSVVLMFLIWNLIYLSLATGIVWALFASIQLYGYSKYERAHVGGRRDKP
jgi:hypothetical protein